MKLPVATTQHTKIGTCPHGLPMGACPICSGSGGGGGSKKIQQNSGEMSWDECFAIGQILKAQKLAQQKRTEAQNMPLENVPVNFGLKISNAAQKVSEFAARIQDSIPLVFSKPIVFVLNKLLVPVLNLIKDIPVKIQQIFISISNFVGEKLKDISDKLNAIFGELKNSTEKKISDKLKDFGRKFKSIFDVYDELDIEDEEIKLEEMEKILKDKTKLREVKKYFNENIGDIDEQN